MGVDAHTPDRFSPLTARLADMMASVSAESGLGWVDHAVRAARTQVVGADSASITSYRRGRFTTSAASDELARKGDHLQYELGSGPCVDAVLTGTVYSPSDLAGDNRWPEYGRQVSVELGVSSMLSFPLHTGSTESIDSLNIYSRAVAAFDDDAVLTGLFIASQAALALGREKVVNLEVALSTSREIGTAIGVLMTGSKLTREQAFGQLRMSSQESNRRLRDVASEVVDTGTLPVGSTARPVRPAGPLRPARADRAVRGGSARSDRSEAPDDPGLPDVPNPAGRVA